MKKLFLLVLFIQIFCISCSKVRPGEHGYLIFENNSSDTIYVENTFSIPDIDILLSETPEDCGIAPGEINYNTLPICSSGMCYSYEYVLGKKRDRSIFVYVVPFYPCREYHEGEELIPIYDYRLICYELTFDDLVSLNFHLYYPPNEMMKNIKMEPPYSYFHSEDK